MANKHSNPPVGEEITTKIVDIQNRAKDIADNTKFVKQKGDRHSNITDNLFIHKNDVWEPPPSVPSKGKPIVAATEPQSKGESSPKPVVKAKAAPVARVPVETTASKAARQEAYVDWKKSQEKLNELVKRKGYAKGGSVKSSVSSRGDGCAIKGRTKGTMR